MMKNKTAGRGYVRKTCNYCNRISGYRSYRKNHHTRGPCDGIK